ncbi:MAG: hypothetical protein R6W48_11490 [Gaiellaceae bacterium]
MRLTVSVISSAVFSPVIGRIIGRIIGGDFIVPVMRSKTRSGTGFTWCYPDNRYVNERLDEAA